MKKNQKASLIVTLKNEQESIELLLNSIVAQSLMPDEIIFTDAGSTDKTKHVIKMYEKKLPQIRIIDVVGSNRSQGRNIAISKAKYDIVAVTDAGCALDMHWFEKITKPIKSEEGNSVAGFYLTANDTVIEKAAAPFVAVMPGDLNPDIYLPSSRSVAFTKAAWEKAGKYPEHANFCEDLLFAQQLKSKTDMVIQPKAIVYWQHFKSFGSFFQQIKNYASGDIEAHYLPHIRKIISVYIRYALFVIIPGLFFAYLLWPIIKHYRHLNHPSALLFLPIFQCITDVAIMVGSAKKIMNI